MTGFFQGRVMFLAMSLTRVLYRLRGTGVPRLAEAIRKFFVARGSANPVLVDVFHGMKFFCFIKEHMGSQIAFRGSYSGEHLFVLNKLLPRDGVFFDVGANQGEFSVFAGGLKGGRKVFAFEPVERNLKRLRANLDVNNLKNVIVVPVALGDEPGEMPIFESAEVFSDSSYHEGLHTLFRSQSRGEQSGLVQVKRLDDLIGDLGCDRLDVMKVDVEGAELSVLRGASETLAKFRPAIIMELCRETATAAGYALEDIVGLLADAGYRMFRIHDDASWNLMRASELADFQNVLFVCGESCAQAPIATMGSACANSSSK